MLKKNLVIRNKFLERKTNQLEDVLVISELEKRFIVNSLKVILVELTKPSINTNSQRSSVISNIVNHINKILDRDEFNKEIYTGNLNSLGNTVKIIKEMRN
jgi:hypothetical protein